MPKDTYLQPHLPDPVLESEFVLSLARRHVPEAQAVVHVDESGGEARSYLVDANLIVKTQRPHRLRPRTSLSKEVFFLNHIAVHAPELAVPRVLGYGLEEPNVEYTVMTRMPGVALREARLDAAQRQAVARELGRTLRRIHGLPQGPLAESGLLPGDRSAADVRRRFEEWFEEMSAHIRDERQPWDLPLSPEQIGERALRVLPDCDERVALHSNPYHEHTYVDPASGTYTALIDFGDAYISHPTFDLRRWRSPAEREALLAGYTEAGSVSEAFQRTWLVAQVLGALAAMAGTPALAEAATEDLRRLLGEL